MIALSTDCLLFQLATGESVPLSADMISIELVDDASGRFDPEVVQHAAASVFHYFKHALGRETVLVAEFAEALEKVLRRLGFDVWTEDKPRAARISNADLDRLAREAGESRELCFFPRLRDELRSQLRQSPRLVRFSGLRPCVKQLAGARRWSARCEDLRECIVDFLRQCLSAESREVECTLVVE